MPALTTDQWAEARATWEADPNISLAEVGRRFGTSTKTVSVRAKVEAWMKVGTMDRINQLALLRAGSGEQGNDSGNVEADKRHLADAVELAVDERAKVIERHRREWIQVAALRQEALNDRAANLPRSFEKAKLAKITAEMTLIQQTGERRAWGFDDAASGMQTTPGNITIHIEREEVLNVQPE